MQGGAVGADQQLECGYTPGVAIHSGQVQGQGGVGVGVGVGWSCVCVWGGV